MSFRIDIRSDTRSALSRMISLCALFKVYSPAWRSCWSRKMAGQRTAGRSGDGGSGSSGEDWSSAGFRRRVVSRPAKPLTTGKAAGDRQSHWRPGEPDELGEPGEPDFPYRWASGRGASLQNVICYLLYIPYFGLRCLRGVKQGIDASGDNI